MLLIINIAGPILIPNFSKTFASNISTTELINLANQDREALGLSPVSLDSRLASAAYNKGQDMLAKGYWAHFGPNGESPWQFIIAAGYSYKYAGENLAKDFSNTAAIHQAWMNSPTHRANIVKAEYVHVGISVVEGTMDGQPTIIVVQMFGTPMNAVAPVAKEPETVAENTPPAQAPKKTTTVQKIAPKPATPTPPSAPKITEPIDGKLQNSKQIGLKGETEKNTSVDIYEAGVKIGSLPTEGGVFSYTTEDAKEGNNSFFVEAISTSTNLRSDKSNIVNVVVDSIPPEVKKSDISVSSKVEENNIDEYIFDIELNPSEAVSKVSIEIDEKSYELAKIDDTKYRLSLAIPTVDLISSDNVVLVKTTDLAGNTTEKSFTKSEILGIDISALSAKYTDIEPEENNKIKEELSNLSIKKSIDLGFIFFLSLLFIIDIFYIKKDKRTRDLWTTRHLPVLIILFIIGILGTNGSVV